MPSQHSEIPPVPPGGSDLARSDATWTERGWVILLALLFLTTALLKLHAGWSGGIPPEVRERVFDLPMTTWSVATGLMELGWVVAVLVSPHPRVSLHLIRLLLGFILGYRLLLEGLGGGYCGCLGGLLADTGWQDREGLLLGGVAGVCFLTNEALLACRWWRALEARLGLPEERLWADSTTV